MALTPCRCCLTWPTPPHGRCESHATGTALLVTRGAPYWISGSAVTADWRAAHCSVPLLEEACIPCDLPCHPWENTSPRPSDASSTTPRLGQRGVAIAGFCSPPRGRHVPGAAQDEKCSSQPSAQVEGEGNCSWRFREVCQAANLTATQPGSQPRPVHPCDTAVTRCLRPHVAQTSRISLPWWQSWEGPSWLSFTGR